MGRPAAGVRGIRLDAGDQIISSEMSSEDADLLVISANGFGKRTALKQFPLQKRGGKGVTAMKRTEKTGKIWRQPNGAAGSDGHADGFQRSGHPHACRLRFRSSVAPPRASR